MAQLSDVLRRNDGVDRRQTERLVRFHFRRSNKIPNQERSGPALAFQFITVFRPSALKDQFTAHLDSFRWITATQ